MTDFAASVKEWGEKTKAEVDAKVRAIEIDLFTSIILGSPVGNPTLWKHKAPKGYVGGRFRNSWSITQGEPFYGADREPNKAGAASMQELKAIGGAGKVTYMANGLPYGERLEFEGWSSQAPMGFVRVNVTRVSESMK